MHRRGSILVVLIVLLSGLGGIASQVWRSLPRRQESPATAVEMKQSLLDLIAFGTPVAEAEMRLRARGFAVERKTNASFIEAGRERQHVDFIYGDMYERSGLIAQKHWQVALVHRDGAVTEICVSVSSLGP